MKNPSHPGLGVKIDCLEPYGISITEGTEILGVTRQTLSLLVPNSLPENHSPNTLNVTFLKMRLIKKLYAYNSMLFNAEIISG